MSSETCDDGALWLHMLLMLTATLVCFPAGVICVYRGLNVWFHIGVQIAGVIIILAGFVVVYATKEMHFDSAHARLGLSLVMLVIAQVLIGALKRILKYCCAYGSQAVKTKQRRQWVHLIENDEDNNENSDQNNENSGENNLMFQQAILFVLDFTHRVLGYCLLAIFFVQIILGLIDYSEHCLPVYDDENELVTSPPAVSTQMGVGAGISFAYNNLSVMFTGWIINHPALYVGTLFFCVGLAVLFEFFKVIPALVEKRILTLPMERVFNHQSEFSLNSRDDQFNEASLPLAVPDHDQPVFLDEKIDSAFEMKPIPDFRDGETRAAPSPPVTPPPAYSTSIWRLAISKILVALLHTTRAFLGYMIMLLLMTYNAGIMIALLVGVFIGSVLFPSPQSSVNCL